MIEIIQHSSGNKYKDFEAEYIKLRSKEARVLTTEEIKQLPFASPAHQKEWELRRQSFDRIKDYIAKKSCDNLLDLACGNGWFLHQVSDSVNKAVGVDINLLELKQAEEVLSKKTNIILHHGDIFEVVFPQKFDMITILAGIQYFPSLSNLITRLLACLNPDGEIHILDSPLYKNQSDQSAAKDRTLAYYSEHGAKYLAQHYHHHLYADLEAYNAEVLFNPNAISQRIRRLINKRHNPFPWIRIRS